MASERNPVVDSLRGIAIFLVLILHFHLTYHLDRTFKFLGPAVSNGNYGVVMFFVISGFLITSTSLKRFGKLSEISALNFYWFRWGRIVPNILLMLAIVVALGLAGVKIYQNDAGGPSLGLTVFSVLSFTHNLLMEKYGYFSYCLNILWSLSVEEVFYFVFPLICLSFKKIKWIALVWGAFIFISPLYRRAHQSDPTDIFGLYDYFACFDGLAIGCVVAIARKEFEIPVVLKKARVPLLLLIAVIDYQGIWSHLVLGISAVSLLTGVILLSTTEGEPAPSFTAPLRYLGKLSYELYLFHIILLAGMRTLVKGSSLSEMAKPFWLIVFLAGSVAIAEWIARYYSEPLNKKVRQWALART